MNDLISVIINTNNTSKFINKCMDSVINQTYKNLEILIIDNDSEDDTLKICEKYAKKDKRIKIIKTKKVWLSVGRNIGIENSNGKYLYFVDSDDFIDTDTIEYLYNLINKYNVKISTCCSYTIYDYNVKKEDIPEKVKIIDSKEMLKKVLLLKDKAGNTWNKLMDKSLFDNYRFEDRIINDMNLMHKIYIEAGNIAFSNQKKYFYLLNESSVTVKEGENSPRLIDKYEVSIDRYNYIKKYYPKMIENDIYLISNTISLYLYDNKEVNEYLDKNNAYKLIKEMFDLKVLFYPFKLKRKIMIILFFINKKLCIKINKKYNNKKNKIKL